MIALLVAAAVLCFHAAAWLLHRHGERIEEETERELLAAFHLEAPPLKRRRRAR